MVRTLIVSALFALAATVYANPAGSLVNINAGHHIGVNDINLQGLGRDAVDARDAEVKDLVQNVDILDDNDYSEGGVSGSDAVPISPPARIDRPVVHEHGPNCGHHSLLGSLLKRKEPSAANSVHMASKRRKNMKNRNNVRDRRH